MYFLKLQKITLTLVVRVKVFIILSATKKSKRLKKKNNIDLHEFSNFLLLHLIV